MKIKTLPPMAAMALGLVLPSSRAQTPTLVSQDVGAPLLAGSMSQAGGKITIVGGGNDIWNASDNFYYAFFQVTNDFDYEAKVEDLQGPDNWTKAELMAREAADLGTGLQPQGDDRHINVMTTRAGGQNEVALQWRSDSRASGSAWPNEIGIAALPPDLSKHLAAAHAIGQQVLRVRRYQRCQLVFASS